MFYIKNFKPLTKHILKRNFFQGKDRGGKSERKTGETGSRRREI